MNTAISPASKKVNWIPMPDPIREEEVNIQLTWTADSRTELAIRRQANLMGFETTAGYITQMIARGLASNDEVIVIETGDLCTKTLSRHSPLPRPKAHLLQRRGDRPICSDGLKTTPAQFLLNAPV